MHLWALIGWFASRWLVQQQGWLVHQRAPEAPPPRSPSPSPSLGRGVYSSAIVLFVAILSPYLRVIGISGRVIGISHGDKSVKCRVVGITHGDNSVKCRVIELSHGDNLVKCRVVVKFSREFIKKPWFHRC